MPPKVKITKDEIVQTALALLRKDGEAAINARSIAAAMHCSTQPVFSNFATMEQLQQTVMEAAYKLYLSFLQAEVESGRYPPYKAYGMAYIRFANEEKELFKLLFMCDREGKPPTPTADFTSSVEMIMQSNAMTRERAERMHLEMWTCVHGIGTMLATSFFAPEWELISEMVTDVYQGLRMRHMQEGNEHGSN